jgi:hypothetical protein
MDIDFSSPIAAALAHRAGRDADGAGIGEAIVSTWQDIDATLRPIIGKRGVEALYKRSLYLTVPNHPWLAETYEENRTRPDVTTLQPVVARQSRVDAASAGTALLQAFYGLLGSFIGVALAERLLHPVWAGPAGRPPEAEASP